MAENSTFPTAHRKIQSTLDYLKHRLRQIESERSVGPLFKHRQAMALKPLQGILKPPTTHFPEDPRDLHFDWTELHDELVVYAINDLAPPPLDSPSDITDGTPTESMVSTPSEPISAYGSWDIDSEYWSNQWDETPQLPSGWNPPLDYLMASEMEESDISEETKPVRMLHQPVASIQAPGDFIEEITSSLQYGLVICGLGFMGFLFLAFWTLLLITCGVMIASVFPAVLVAYGFMVLFTHTECSVEWLLMTTLKTAGGLTLGIGIALVIIVELIGDTVFNFRRRLAGNAPAIVFLSALSIVLCTKLERSKDSSDMLANSTKYLIY
ncbi:hypothetical protein OPQ81_002395 [Rhizoctonia solani]|nr:hypothetical protein OPQ81_002395 [Rhizoctonia solani]